MLVLDLDSAAEHLHQVGDYVALEYPHIVRFQAVEYLAAHRHDPLKLRVARELARAECGVALHDVYLAALRVAAAAVDKLLHAVRDIYAAGELLLHALPRALRRLAAALVYQHLVGYPVGLRLVLNEVYL